MARLDPTGAWLWATQAGGASGAAGTRVAVDAAGNAYATGLFDGRAPSAPPP